MSPAEAGAATVIVICAAVYTAYRILCWLLDRHIRARRDENRELDRWQQAAADAARRSEDDVRRDLAAAKAARDLVEQLTFDIAFAKITATEFPSTTHQTRRTEDNQ